MDLGKLLGALDGDDIKDALELLRENRGLLEQLGKLGDHLAETGGEARGFLHS
jgi:hypothetical protein